MKEFDIGMSWGGSILFNPDRSFNTAILNKYARVLQSYLDKTGKSLFIVTGGGPYARLTMAELTRMGKTSQSLHDTVGIAFTHINASLVSKHLQDRGVDAKYVPVVSKKSQLDARVIFTGGTKIKQTSDGVLVEKSEVLGYHHLINVTNIEYVYRVKRKKIDFTQPIINMTWDELIAIIGTKHKAGENFPFSTAASKMASDLGLTVKIVGHDPKNLTLAMNGKRFKGTTVHP